MDTENWECVGNNDLRISITPIHGFRHIVLRDADDGDVIVINEDDVEVLRDRLTKELQERSVQDAGTEQEDRGEGAGR